MEWVALGQTVINGEPCCRVPALALVLNDIEVGTWAECRMIDYSEKDQLYKVSRVRVEQENAGTDYNAIHTLKKDQLSQLYKP